MSGLAGQSEPSKRLPVDDALAQLQRFSAQNAGQRDLRLCVKAFNPGGLTGHQTVEVEALYRGMDWEAGRVIVVPARPMTWLAPEDVAAIRKSVTAGQSWHAMQAHNRVLAKLSEALGCEVRTTMEAVEAIQRLKAAA